MTSSAKRNWLSKNHRRLGKFVVSTVCWAPPLKPLHRPSFKRGTSIDTYGVNR